MIRSLKNSYEISDIEDVKQVWAKAKEEIGYLERTSILSLHERVDRWAIRILEEIKRNNNG